MSNNENGELFSAKNVRITRSEIELSGKSYPVLQVSDVRVDEEPYEPENDTMVLLTGLFFGFWGPYIIWYCGYTLLSGQKLALSCREGLGSSGCVPELFATMDMVYYVIFFISLVVIYVSYKLLRSYFRTRKYVRNGARLQKVMLTTPSGEVESFRHVDDELIGNITSAIKSAIGKS